MWFFSADNPEVLVKVLDGCGFNDRFWVFYAAATTAGFDLTVKDTRTGLTKTYSNPDRTQADPVTDIEAFDICDGRGGSSSAPVPEPRATRSDTTPSGGGTSPCVPDEQTLCVDRQPGDGRFRVTVQYDTVLGSGAQGDAGVVPLTPLGIERGGILWFFDESNPEVLVKVLDGCSFNGHFWVFYSATTTAGLTLTVEDTLAGASASYVNPDLTPAAPVSDVEALATCSF